MKKGNEKFVGAAISRPHFEEKTQNNKGITLIALIVTIIVMLILVGVTVNVAINGGLFDTSKEAATKTEMETIRERAEIVRAVLIADSKNNDTIIANVATYKKRLQQEFEGSQIGFTKVIVENGKYDIIILNEKLDIEVRIHNDEDSFIAQEDINAEGNLYAKTIKWDDSIAMSANVGTKEEIIDGYYTVLLNCSNLWDESIETKTIHNNLEEWIADKDTLSSMDMAEIANIESKEQLYIGMLYGDPNMEITDSQRESLIEDLYTSGFGEKTPEEVCGNTWVVYIYKNGNIEDIRTNMFLNMGVPANNEYLIQDSSDYLFVTKSITGEELSRREILGETSGIIDNDYGFVLAEGDKNWETDGNGTITKCNLSKTTSEIVIPYRIGNEKIIAIGSGIFEEYSMSKIIIPDNIQTIGEGAFAECSNLKEIVLPESVKTIGKGAFASSGLEEIIIPEGVTKIEMGTFYNCESLANVELPLTLESIDAGAFMGCNALKEIYIPENVNSIVFLNGGYNEDTLITFYNTFVTVDKNNKTYRSEDGVLFNKDKTELIYYPQLKAETTYTIPNTVNTIGTFAFYNTQIKEINIPSNVKTIEDCAFMWSYLEKINVEEGLESIGKAAFAYSSFLDGADITLPNSVTYIGDSAFNITYGPPHAIANIYFAPGNNPIPEGRPWGSGATVTKLNAIE